jgi:RND family efflux transporter MFP subunit
VYPPLIRIPRRALPRWLPVCAAALLAHFAFHPSAAAEGPTRPVTLAEVRQESLREQISLSGTSVPKRHVMLTPRVEGLVTEVLVDEGGLVETGDPLLLLDDRLARIAVRAASARVQEAKARHEDAIRVRDELLRLKKGRHASATSIESAIAEVDVTAAALAREQAELERARELQSRHSVIAPFAGMVVEKQAESGQWVQRDDTVVELVSIDTLRVRAPLPQRYFPRVRNGAAAWIRFDALPDSAFEGQVTARVSLGSEGSRSFPLLIDIPNPDLLLAPGMSARVDVELENGTGQALTVPRDAVVARADGSREVWRVREDDGLLRAYPVPVQTGRAQGARLEVVGGDLAAGDRVVLLGNEGLQPGQAVAVKEGGPAVAAERP